jgi:hypothetical protein
MLFITIIIYCFIYDYDDNDDKIYLKFLCKTYKIKENLIFGLYKI